MLFEMSEVVFAGMADMALPEMMTPAVFKMAVAFQSVSIVTPVGIMGIIPIAVIVPIAGIMLAARIIPIGGSVDIDNLATISVTIITALVSLCIVNYFFGPF